MASGWTNRGKYADLGQRFNAATAPTNYYARLVTSATAPTADTNTASELTEIASGNGYTAGGISLSKNATDFPNLTEDDINDRATIDIKDLVWTASGGSLPGSGSGARWLVITDDNVTDGSREIYFYFDLTSDRTVSDGQTLTITNAEIRIGNCP